MRFIRRIAVSSLVVLSVILIILPAIGRAVVMADPDTEDPAMLKWVRTDTPGSIDVKNDIVTPSEVNRIVIGADGKTFYAVDIPYASNIDGRKALYKSLDGGISWSDLIGVNLYRAMSPAERLNFHIWNIVVARDDVKYIAAVTSSAVTNRPRNVWVSTDGGSNWNSTNCPMFNNISSIDISPDSSGRVIAIGTRNGAGGGDVFTFKATGYGTWTSQTLNGDVLSLRFSPSYVLDTTIVAIYTNMTGTYLNAGVYDAEANRTNWASVYGGSPPEVTMGGGGTSPKAVQIISADLELPSDFSGQAASLRRYYVSTDAPAANAGVYRFDDRAGYWLMQATPMKRISDIAYHGSYSHGKLLVGEVLGQSCMATVMTWFTDAPMTCPDTCWYTSKKPPTGAAGTDNCTGSGYGNAQVAWSPDGSLSYCGTASTAPLVAGAGWATPYLTGESFDESAFSVSHDDGETWNQLSLIDTRITQFVDLAPSPDNSTFYLASVNNGVNCSGFDSVWRSLRKPTGSSWERVLCKPTTHASCGNGQTDQAILALAGDKPDGSIVFWAARGTQALWWSSDYGDHWDQISPSFNIQDMAAEDSTTLYLLDTAGSVQILKFSGTGWMRSPIKSTGLETSYSIATAYTGMTPDNDKGTVIVGSTGAAGHDVAYSTDGGGTFTEITRKLPTVGNALVAAVSGFRSDGTIIAINDGGMYAWSVYGDYDQQWQAWWGGSLFASPVTSIAISRNYSFYFSEPGLFGGAATPYIRYSAAHAGLDPSVALGSGAMPTRRLKISGGLIFEQPVHVWVIDQRPYAPPAGGLWHYIDTLAWSGPSPTQPANRMPVEFDPVSGRANEVNMKWRFKSLSRGYRIQIAKDRDFNLLFADIGASWSGPFYTPFDYDSPALVISPGGGKVMDRNTAMWIVPALEAGHPYYWRVRVQDVLTDDSIKSPWSYGETFIIMAGLQVTTPYYGPQLLYPKDGSAVFSDKTLRQSDQSIVEKVPLTMTPLFAWFIIAICIMLIIVMGSMMITVLGGRRRKLLE